MNDLEIDHMSVVVTPNGTRGVKLPVPKSLIALLTRIPVGMQRLSGGRMKMHGEPLLLLFTRGARSGQPRTSMLAQFPEPDGSTLIVASFGGAVKHPDWYFNLAKHPDEVFIEKDGRRVRVEPRSLSGEERRTAWQRIVKIAPGFAEYQHKTDRELPVIRLSPIS
jgi:deazaflavin-dependent oxidoreductase (nitroreductase family)